MIEVELNDDQSPLPESMTVSVLMECRPGVTRWASEVWQAVGVTVGEGPAMHEGEVVVDRGDYRQLVYGGFRVRMHRDEAADYYHNLMSPAPGCYVVADAGGGYASVPRPVLVTLSFDEANAYAEGDAQVYHVPLPAALYHWVERFVVMHYVPEQKRKRRLKSADEQRGGGAEK